MRNESMRWKPTDDEKRKRRNPNRTHDKVVTIQVKKNEVMLVSWTFCAILSRRLPFVGMDKIMDEKDRCILQS